MLPDALAQAVREVGEAAGGVLLVDAGRGRALLTDTARIVELCRNLRRAGFTRMVDFTGLHSGGDEFTFYLTLRAPEHGHAALILKWKWHESVLQAAVPADIAAEQSEAEKHVQNDAALQAAQGTQPRRAAPPAANYNSTRGAGQPGDELQAGPAPHVHPSLSTIWPAAALAERELFEMLGLPFAGNDLAPLLLPEDFAGNPLRRDYAAPARETYIQRLLRQRHEQGLLGALRHATEGQP